MKIMDFQSAKTRLGSQFAQFRSGVGGVVGMRRTHVIKGALVGIIIVTAISSLVEIYRIVGSTGIHVISASYGKNCDASSGNVTTILRNACNGLATCRYVVDVNQLGNPNPGCAKAFTVEYECPDAPTHYKKEIPGEAGLGSLVLLRCIARGITVHSATYGGTVALFKAMRLRTLTPLAVEN